MIKVLVVDDSALMRRHLSELLRSQPDIDVRTARNGVEALATIEEYDPNVITLDVNMPEMDGITCLSEIMVRDPRPVVMISSITQNGAEVTLQALRLGAVDFVEKPGGTISLSIDVVHAQILAKVRSAATARVRRGGQLSARMASHQRAANPAQPAPPSSAKAVPGKPRMGLVLIGVSTGGPGALDEILPKLSSDFPWPVLVAQHMPRAFTNVFARRLNEACALNVVEVERQTPIEPGTIYIARGDADLLVTRGALGPKATPVPASPDHLWHPSVERLVSSALEVMAPTDLIGVQLTGMGHDGAEAMTQIKARGGRTIAQDEASSVVFGMPQELIKRGGATSILPSSTIAAQLQSWLASQIQSSRKEHRDGAG